MISTPISLLERLRHPELAEAWNQFVRLYAPLIVRFVELQGFRDADAEDAAQEVLLKLVRLMPTYQRREGQTFRGWLFAICRNECRDFRVRRATRPLPTGKDLTGLADDAEGPEPDEAEYRRLLLGRALDMVGPDFGATTWTAFKRFVLEGESAAVVARDLGISANAVYLARNRILTRLRTELQDLIE